MLPDEPDFPKTQPYLTEKARAYLKSTVAKKRDVKIA